MLKHTKLVFYRILHNKVFLTTYLLLIPIVMGLAIYMTNSISYHMQVGIVGDIQTVQNEYITYIPLEEVPANSKLVLNQYDAVLYQDDNGLHVLSTKGEEFDQALPYLISGQIDHLQSDDTKRGAATNIIGFLMMVIGLLGVQIYSYYFDERGGINRRIMSTSMRTDQYMLSHFIIVMCFLFIPAALVTGGAISIFNISLTMPLWKFMGVLALLCFFSTSFGLWINSISKSIEESMMFGNMFAIVASIVSGGFVVVTDNEIFNNIVQCLPQKQIMSLLEALEHQAALPWMGILYILCLSFILIGFAMHIEKKKLANR